MGCENLQRRHCQCRSLPGPDGSEGGSSMPALRAPFCPYTYASLSTANCRNEGAAAPSAPRSRLIRKHMHYQLRGHLHSLTGRTRRRFWRPHRIYHLASSGCEMRRQKGGQTAAGQWTRYCDATATETQMRRLAPTWWLVPLLERSNSMVENPSGGKTVQAHSLMGARKQRPRRQKNAG